MNTVNLIVRMTKDPSVKEIDKGKDGKLLQAVFTLAVNDDRLWYMTVYNGRRGWTSSRYLKPAKVVEATASVYVRYLPGVGSRNVAWYQVVIDADESLGWVFGKYSQITE